MQKLEAALARTDFPQNIGQALTFIDVPVRVSKAASTLH